MTRARLAGRVAALAIVGAALAAAPALGQSRADLERESRRLQSAHEALDRDSAQALEHLLAGIRGDVAARRRDIAAKLRDWTADPSDASIADIDRQIREALPLARDSGLDVARLTRIYDLTRQVIRTADFPSPEATNPVLGSALAQRVTETLAWALGEERGLAEAQRRHQEYKVGLYKRAMLAYLRALLATPMPPPPGCAPGPGRLAIVRGVQVPLVDCPDPVVDGLRAYLDAVRTLQSADADALLAEAEALVAEQQLVADVAAGLPLVGDALDIYAVWSGEDLAGTPMTPGMRAFSALMILVPNVGPFAWEQAMQRSPTARQAAETMAAYLEAAKETAGIVVDVYAQATGELVDYLGEAIARRWNTTMAHLDDLAQSLRSSRRSVQALTDAERDQIRIYQNLRAAAQDQIDLAALPAAYRKRAADSAAHRAARTLGAAQAESIYERIRRSGIVGKHAEVLSDVARDSGQIMIVRPVNPSATALIEMGWATKPMGIKLKSADVGAIAGAIPVNQRLNKTGTALREAEEQLLALKRRAGAASDVEQLEKAVEKLKGKLDEGNEYLAKCFASTPPCAQKVPHPSGVMEAADAAGKPVFVMPDGKGGWLDVDTDAPVRVSKEPAPVLILGDPVSGKPLTADYDLLATADRGPLTTPRFNEQTGFITEGQKQAVADINDRVNAKARAAGAEGASVVHHGAEQNFPGTPGVDYPLTAFQPDGQIVTIPVCDEACMKHWCSVTRMCDPGLVPGRIKVDPHRLAKDYFHDMRHRGFNLYPSPQWGWGAYNPLGGWLGLEPTLPTRAPRR